LIQLPALLIGLEKSETVVILGTNKVPSVFGTTASALIYRRNIKTDSKLLLAMALPAFLGSMGGASLASRIPTEMWVDRDRQNASRQWRAIGLAAADGQPPARGVHRRNRGTEDPHPARTRHACDHWANPQPRCTLKLTAMRRDPRPRRRHVQRDPCRGLHRAPALRPASSKRRRDLRRAHRPPSKPSVKSTLPYPK
jgi:hypothetical protein